MDDADLPPATEDAAGLHRARTALVVVLLLAITTFGTWLRAQDLDAPWERGFRGVLGGGTFASIVMTYETHGVATLRGVPSMDVGGVRETPIQYFHHPPLYPLSLVAWGKAFGRSETSWRTLSLMFSVGGLLLFFGLVRSLWRDDVVALAATGLLATLPMAASYGHFASYEPFVLFFALASTWSLLVWHRTGRARHLLLAIVWMTVSAFFDWPGYFYAPMAATVVLLAPRRRRWLPAFGFIGLGFAMFGLFTLYGTYGRGAFGDANPIAFLEEFLHFGLDVGDRGADVTPAMWWEAHRETYLHFFGVIPLLLAAIGLGDLLFGKLWGTLKREAAFSVALAVPAILNITFFWHNAHGHNFHTYYSIAPIALWGGLALGFPFRAGLASRRPATAVAMLGVLVLAGWRGTQATLDEYRRVRTDAHAVAGRFIAEHVDSGTLVLTSKNLFPALFYANRCIPPMHIRTFKQLETVGAFVDQFDLRFDDVVFVVDAGQEVVVTKLLKQGAKLGLIGPSTAPSPLAESDGLALYALPRVLVDHFRASTQATSTQEVHSSPSGDPASTGGSGS